MLLGYGKFVFWNSDLHEKICSLNCFDVLLHQTQVYFYDFAKESFKILVKAHIIGDQNHIGNQQLFFYSFEKNKEMLQGEKLTEKIDRNKKKQAKKLIQQSQQPYTAWQTDVINCVQPQIDNVRIAFMIQKLIKDQKSEIEREIQEGSCNAVISENKDLIWDLLSSVDATVWQLEIMSNPKSPTLIKHFYLCGILNLGQHQMVLSNVLDTDLSLQSSNRVLTEDASEYIKDQILGLN